METIVESPQILDDFVMDYDDFGDRFDNEVGFNKFLTDGGNILKFFCQLIFFIIYFIFHHFN